MSLNQIGKKEVIDNDITKEDLINIISNEIKDVKNNNFTEDKFNKQTHSEEFTSKQEIARKNNIKLELENPLAMTRVWSPYVLYNEQSNKLKLFLLC